MHCLNLIHTVEDRITRTNCTRVPAMSRRRTCKNMPGNLVEQELAITITRSKKTHPFEIEPTEKSRVHVFFVILCSVVIPQECGQFGSGHVDLSVLKFLASPVY